MVNVAGIEHQITECPGPFVAMGQGCEKKTMATVRGA